MPSLYVVEDEYTPELAPQPVQLPDGSTYTGEQAAAPAAPPPENYIPGSTYIPPGAAESPQTANPAPAPDYSAAVSPTPSSPALDAAVTSTSQNLPPAYQDDPAVQQDMVRLIQGRGAGGVQGMTTGPTTIQPPAPLPATPSPSTNLGGPSQLSPPSGQRVGTIFHPQGTGAPLPARTPPPPINSRGPSSYGARSEFGWDDLNRAHGNASGSVPPRSTSHPAPPGPPSQNYSILGETGRTGRRPGAVDFAEESTSTSTTDGRIQWPVVPDEFTQSGNPVPAGGYTSPIPASPWLAGGVMERIARNSAPAPSAPSSSRPPAAPLTLGQSSTPAPPSVGDAFGTGMGGPVKDAVLAIPSLLGGAKDNAEAQAKRDLGMIGQGGFRTGPTAALSGLMTPPRTRPTGQIPDNTGSYAGPTKTPSSPAVDRAVASMTPTERGMYDGTLTNAEGKRILDYPVIDAGFNLTPKSLSESLKEGSVVDVDGTYYFGEGVVGVAGQEVTPANVKTWVATLEGGTPAAPADTPSGELAAQPLPVTPVETGTTTGTSSGGDTNSGGSGRAWQDWSNGGGGGGGRRSWSSGGGGGGGGRSFGGFDFGNDDFNPDTDGDGKISRMEAKAAKKRRGRKGRMGQGGTMMPGGPPSDIRAYILGQLGEGFGRPVGGWPEGMNMPAPASGGKKKKNS